MKLEHNKEMKATLALALECDERQKEAEGATRKWEAEISSSQAALDGITGEIKALEAERTEAFLRQDEAEAERLTVRIAALSPRAGHLQARRDAAEIAIDRLRKDQGKVDEEADQAWAEYGRLRLDAISEKYNAYIVKAAEELHRLNSDAAKWRKHGLSHIPGHWIATLHYIPRSGENIHPADTNLLLHGKLRGEKSAELYE